MRANTSIKKSPAIAHNIPGRLRIKLPSNLNEIEQKSLIQDLKVSPEVKKVTLKGSSLIIEHTSQNGADLTVVGQAINRVFPEFVAWSDEIDEEIARAVGDPSVNKMIPLLFLGLAGYVGMANGAILAGESAFALGYVAFDLYWKFQQENVIRKIEKGLSQKDKSISD